MGKLSTVTCPKTSLSPVRVLIASGPTLFREGLRGLLEAGGFEVAGETADGRAVVSLAAQTKADVILLDLDMPQQNGLEVLRQLSHSDIPARTLLLTHSVDRQQIVRALKLGANGMISLDSTTERLFDGIRALMEGKYWVESEQLSDLIGILRDDNHMRDDNRVEEISQQKDFGLTPREREIVALVVAGYSNPEMAQRFSISQQTVKHHVSNVFDKLGVSNRLELALFAVNHRLTDAELA
jgi:DNA-binding NarL/FixJ family response regulator